MGEKKPDELLKSLVEYLKTGSTISATTLDFTVATFPAGGRKFDVNNPPGTIETRVFVGGNYDLMPILRFIEAIVVRQGLVPILADDFDIPEDKTGDYILRLIHQCRRAVYDVTVSTIQVGFEIGEISKSPNILMLMVGMAKDSSKTIPRTSMFRTYTKPPPKGYETIGELNSIVTNFLRTPPP